MDDLRLGSLFRLVRHRRSMRQVDVAMAARVSTATVSRIERGHLRLLSVDRVRRVAAVLEIRVEMNGRWRGGEVDRLLGARHSALHESVARAFHCDHPDWVLRPEVSFSFFGERGVIDIVGWHADRRALLVIELKTEITDVNELVGTIDRKRRLAPRAVADQGWSPRMVASWVIVAPGRTNRRRITEHRALLRAAFPQDGRSIGGWLRDPATRLDVLSIWPDLHPWNVRPDLAPIRRVRRPARAATTRRPSVAGRVDRPDPGR
jgi:transcriptional regulator with XRE-family HTH domain